MMGVLNFAHASVYMLGAYFAYDISRHVGFWPALVLAPVLCGAVGALIEMYGLRRVHKNGHIAELLFTFGLAFIIDKAVQMAWGLLPVAYRVPPVLDHPLFTIYGTNFHAYRGFMLLISALMFCAIWLMLTRTRASASSSRRPSPIRRWSARSATTCPASSPRCSPADRRSPAWPA